MYRHYIASRADRNLWASEMPIGDPFGGSAYGEMLDIGGIVGGLVGGNAAGDALKAQSQGVGQANQLLERIYNDSKSNLLPFLNNGTAANNQLAYLLGLNPAGNSGSKIYTENDLFDTSQNVWRPNADLYASSPEYRRAYDAFVAQHQAKYGTSAATSKGSNLDNAENQLMGYGFDINAYNKKIQDQQRSAAAADPNYGSLLRNFSQSDLDNDVVYNTGLKFGLDQGTQGINRQAAATGGLLSGATLKALTRFGNDYGTTKANDAYNRYNNNRQLTYNMLSRQSNSGQSAANSTNAAAQNYGNQVSNNLVGLGNARGASSIAQGNSYGDALGGIIGFGAKTLFGIK